MSATVAPGQQVGGLVAETGRPAARPSHRRRPSPGHDVGAQRRARSLLFLLFVFPVYWMVNTSLQPEQRDPRLRRRTSGPTSSRCATTSPCCSTERVERSSCPRCATRS